MQTTCHPRKDGRQARDGSWRRAKHRSTEAERRGEAARFPPDERLRRVLWNRDSPPGLLRKCLCQRELKSFVLIQICMCSFQRDLTGEKLGTEGWERIGLWSEMADSQACGSSKLRGQRLVSRGSLSQKQIIGKVHSGNSTFEWIANFSGQWMSDRVGGRGPSLRFGMAGLRSRELKKERRRKDISRKAAKARRRKTCCSPSLVVVVGW